LAELFGNAPQSGMLLLRMRMSGENSFIGSAFVLGTADCRIPYSVQGTLSSSTLDWWGYEPKDADRACRVTRTAYTHTSLRLVWSPPPPSPSRPQSAKTPEGSTPFTLARFAKLISPLIVIIAIVTASTIGVVLLRFGYLHRLRGNRLLPRPLPPAPREPASVFSSSLPSSSGKILGNRQAIVTSDAAFVAAHTEWLRRRAEQADAAGELVDARLRFAEKLAHLATVPALMNTSDPHATPTSFSLSLAEIEQMIAAMPEVTPELRGAVLRLLHARLKEKLQ
jgi:hypothetical protein